MVDYWSLYKRYKNANPHSGGRYIRRFVGLVEKERIPVNRLDDFHEKWKHQLSKGFNGSTVYIYRWQCRQFIEWVVKLYEDKKDNGRKTVITG